MFITDFISKVFNAIVDQRNRALEEAQRRDPAYQKILAEVERSEASLNKWVQGQLKKDPELARRYERLNASGETSAWSDFQHYAAIHYNVFALTGTAPDDEAITLTHSFGESFSSETFGTPSWDQDAAAKILDRVVNILATLQELGERNNVGKPYLADQLNSSTRALSNKSTDWQLRALREMRGSIPEDQRDNAHVNQLLKTISNMWGLVQDHDQNDTAIEGNDHPQGPGLPQSEGTETNPPYPGAEWTSIVEDCAWPLAHEVAVRCYEEKPVEPGSSKRFSGVRKNFRDCDWINVIFRQKYLSLYIKGVDRDWEGLFDAIGVQPEIRRWRDGVQVRCRTSQEVLAAMNWLELPLSS